MRETRMNWRAVVVAVCVVISAFCGGANTVAAEPAGRTWHVSPVELPGVDKSLQLRSVTAAAERVEAGDTVVIHGGTYREHVVVTRSGTAEKPISFVAAPGEYVLLTGA